VNRTLHIIAVVALCAPLAAGPSAAPEAPTPAETIAAARAGSARALGLAAREVARLGDQASADQLRQEARDLADNGDNDAADGDHRPAIRAYCGTIERAWKKVAAAYDTARARDKGRTPDAADALRRREHAFHTSLYAWAPWAAPPTFLDRIHAVGDLTQTARSAKLPGGGRTCCGPVSVANSLAWLAETGYPALAPDRKDRNAAVAALARTLSGAKYMNTSMKKGTGATGVIRGVRKLLAERKCTIKRLEYQGWRTHPKESGTGVAVPQLAWLKKALLGNSGVWLNVGWYTHDESTGDYERIGGHWVTLVGYRVELRKAGEATVLVLHDPGSRAGPKFANEFVLVEPITSGKLTGKQRGLPRSAAGYVKLTDGMHVRSSADAAILDGAVVLELAP